MTIIRQLMSTDVRTCRPSDSLNEVAQILWESDCGVVPVVDERGRVLGMVTDRDACMAAYTRGARLTELRAFDAMSAGAARCLPSDDLESALRTMAARQVHRLPVVDEQERVVGVLSLSDAFRAAAALKGAARQRLALQVLAAAAAITRPRSASCALPGAEASPAPPEMVYEAR
jgi:CBS domain-containing protein